MDIALAFDRERAWYEFLQRFTAKDLEDVVHYLQAKIKKGERQPGALRFRNLVEQLDFFDEEKCLAAAEKRNLKPLPTPKERIVQQFRPAALPETAIVVTAKPISHYIEQLREAAR